MIDFRYHLISIVAVFLALGIGILMGSVVLDQQLVKTLENRLNGIESTNQDLRSANQDLRRRVELDETFAIAARDLLLREALEDTEVVMLTVAGTDGGLLDAVRSGIDQAGGEVAGMLTATEKLALPRDPERNELALIVDSVTGAPEDLLADAGTLLGERASAAAAAQASDPGPEGVAPQEPGSGRTPQQRRLDDLVDDMEESGFLDLERGDGDLVVPPGALFVVVVGSESAPPFEVSDFTLALAEGLSRPGVGVVVAESSNSEWGLTDEIRADDDARDVVATVDQAESTSGTIAVVLALEQAENGCTGHYGVRGGVAGIIPRPSDDC